MSVRSVRNNALVDRDPMLNSRVLERIAVLARDRGLTHAWSDERQVLTISDSTTASYHRTLRVHSPSESEEIWFGLGLGIEMLHVVDDESDAEMALTLAEDIFAGAVREVVVIPPAGPPVTTEWLVGREDSPVSYTMTGPGPISYEGTTVVIQHGPWPSQQSPQDVVGLANPHRP